MIGRPLRRLKADTRGNAAAEMALVMPLLLIIMLGSVELGNYFLDEHVLVKAVRDGARYAARQAFANYNGCTGTAADVPQTVKDNTKLIVRKGTLDSNDPDLLPNWSTATFNVTCRSLASAGGQTMSGLYTNNPAGTAEIVIVSTTLTYRPVLAVALGFSGVGYQIYASSQAAVSGI